MATIVGREDELRSLRAFLGQAREAIERQQIETANDRLHRTQYNIQEHMLTHDTSEDVGRQLESL